MKISKDDAELRDYLLGLVGSDRKRQEIEEKLMVDDEYYERLVAEEDMLIDSYIDETLPVRERSAFEDHFLIPQDRRDKLRFARSLEKHLSQTRPRTVTEGRSIFAFLQAFKTRLAFGLAVVLVVGAAAILVWISTSGSDDREALLALNRAYASGRPFEARISGFDYAPYDRSRGAGSNATVDLGQRDTAELILRRDLDRAPSTDTLHSLGRLYLSKGDLSKAEEFLSKGRGQAPNDPDIANDLGILYLQKYLSDSGNAEPTALAKALENFQTAIDLDPKDLPANYNRAVSLHLMALPNQEREAWQHYLDLDPSSPWADEARKNLENIRVGIDKDIPAAELEKRFDELAGGGDDDALLAMASSNRELIREKYLPQTIAFSIVDSDGDPADTHLAALSRLAKLEKERLNDRFAADLYQTYSDRAGSRRAILKEAQDQVREGYQLCLHDQFAAAADTFANAYQLFIKANDAAEANTVAEYFRAYALESIGRVAEADGIFANVKRFSEEHGYRWFGIMTTYWWLGSQEYLGLRSFTETRDGYKSALLIAEDMGDGYMVQKLLLSVVLEDQRVGQDEATLDDIFELLRFSERPDLSVRQKYRNLDKIIQITGRSGLYAFSKAVLNESLTLSTQIDEPAFKFGAALNAGIVNTNSHAFEDAGRWFDKAQEETAVLSDASLKNNYLSRLYLERGHLEEGLSDSAKALSLFDSALDLANVAPASALTFDIRKARIRTLATIGDDTQLSTEIPQTIDLAEQYRARILDERERSSFFESENEIYEAGIGNALRLGDPQKAYEFAEMSSSRSLLDRLRSDPNAVVENGRTTGSLPSLTLEEVRARLPANIQLIEYRVLPDSIVIWVVSKDHFSCIRLPVASKDLDLTIDGYLASLRTRDTAASVRRDEISRQLYQILISPIEASLDREKELAIIPSKALFYFPFAALLSPDGDRLIQEYRLTYAPSASVFLHCSELASKREVASGERVLSVGNPAFDSVRFPDLARIADSATEAKAISDIYSSTDLLTGRGATKTEFMSSARAADVVHFAGHYLVDPRSPQLSKLILANAPGDDAYVTNAEISQMRFPSTRLVVLSACRTALEDTLQGEGAIGLARTFIGSGVPLVVATQWPVDSAATTDLMISFHKLRHSGLSTAEALRQAQIAFLTRDDKTRSDPYYWAGFGVYGGTASF
jgi:CHAT domain-containing protein